MTEKTHILNTKKLRLMLFLGLFIFISGLVIRLAYISTIDNPYLTFLNDTGEYNRLAKHLIEKHEYAEEALRAYRPPLYPMFLALVYLISGFNPPVIRVIQSILGALTAVCIFMITFKITGRVWLGFLAGIVVALFRSLILFNGILLTESLFIFGLYSAIFFTICVFNTELKIYQILAGIFWGLSCLTRPIPLMFLPMFLFLILLINREIFRLFWKKIILVFLFMILTIFPWIIRNFIIFGTLVPVSTNFGINFSIGNHPGAPGRYSRSPILPQWAKMPEIERDRYAKREALRFIINNPGEFISICKKRLKISLLGGRKEFYLFKHYNGYQVGNISKAIKLPVFNVESIKWFAFLGFLYCTGIIVTERKTKCSERQAVYLSSLLCWSMLLYFIFFNTIVVNDFRFNLPTLPLWCIFSALGIYSIYIIFSKFITHFKSKRFFNLLPAIFLLCILMILSIGCAKEDLYQKRKISVYKNIYSALESLEERLVLNDKSTALNREFTTGLTSIIVPNTHSDFLVETILDYNPSVFSTCDISSDLSGVIKKEKVFKPSINFGKLKVKAKKKGVMSKLRKFLCQKLLFPIFSIYRRLEINYADKVVLKGYRLESAEFAPGEEIKMQIFWQRIGPLSPSEDYRVFVHIDHIGKPAFRISGDHYPCADIYPTHTWSKNKVIKDKFYINIPSDAPEGEYSLRIGLFNTYPYYELPINEPTLWRIEKIRFKKPPRWIIKTDKVVSDKITLVGINIMRQEYHPGESLICYLLWKRNKIPLEGEEDINWSIINKKTGKNLAIKNTKIDFREDYPYFVQKIKWRVPLNCPQGKYEIVITGENKSLPVIELMIKDIPEINLGEFDRLTQEKTAQRKYYGVIVKFRAKIFYIFRAGEFEKLSSKPYVDWTYGNNVIAVERINHLIVFEKLKNLSELKYEDEVFIIAEFKGRMGKQMIFKGLYLKKT